MISLRDRNGARWSEADAGAPPASAVEEPVSALLEVAIVINDNSASNLNGSSKRGIHVSLVIYRN